MVPYLALLALITVTALVSSVTNNELIGFIVISVSLFLLMGLRAKSVGADTENYVNLFVIHGAFSGGIRNIWESTGGITALYDIWAYIVYLILPYEQAILITNSAIIVLGVALFINEFANNKLYSLLLYVFSFCYFFAFNGMRQSLAGSLVLMAVVLFSHGRRIWPFLLAICAIGVHQTSIFLIFALAASWIAACCKWLTRDRLLAIALAAAFLISSLYTPLFNTFTSIFDHYSMYEQGQSQFSSSDATQGRQAILYLVILVFVMVVIRNSAGGDHCLTSSRCGRTIWFMGSMCIGFGIFCTSYELLARLLFYLVPFFCCSLDDVCFMIDKKNRTVLFRFSIAACYLVLCIYMLSSNYSIVLPYVLGVSF